MENKSTIEMTMDRLVKDHDMEIYEGLTEEEETVAEEQELLDEDSIEIFEEATRNE